jgi:AraC-like DNA-binding protein
MTMHQDEHTRERLDRARAFIDEHYDLPLDLAQIAAQAHFSHFYFLRMFQRAFALTPHQYLTQRRIEQAKQLLASSDLSVTEVCFAVGFASLGSFSTLFHRTVGRPPTVYRARVFTGWRVARARIPTCFLRMFGIDLRPAR